MAGTVGGRWWSRYLVAGVGQAIASPALKVELSAFTRLPTVDRSDQRFSGDTGVTSSGAQYEKIGPVQMTALVRATTPCG